MEQEKADQSMLKLAEEQKQEKDKLHKIYLELEKQLEAKHTLELEIERLKGAGKGDADLKKKLESIQQELAEKVEELDASRDMQMTLLVKERIANDELQEARQELIGGLEDCHATNICVKKMGLLDLKPFEEAAKRKYGYHREQVWRTKYREWCCTWLGHIKNPSWHPFKLVPVGDRHEEIIDHEDEKLKSLRDEFGDKPYAAVITALKELKEYDPSGREPTPELWNAKEEKRATIKEVVSYILERMKPRKRKKK